jgi:hypothetical protein
VLWHDFIQTIRYAPGQNLARSARKGTPYPAKSALGIFPANIRAGFRIAVARLTDESDIAGDRDVQERPFQHDPTFHTLVTKCGDVLV